MNRWKKPEVKGCTEDLNIQNITEEQMMEINGGVKVGVCVGVGLGGDWKKGTTPVMVGLCYVVGV